MATLIIPVESFDMVIFGASGDLAQRKILPGLYHRLVAGQFPPTARIIGAARSKWTREEFQKKATESYFEFVPEHEQNPEMFKTFLNCLHYVSVDAMGSGGWDELTALVNDNPNPVRAFYLSVGPSLFGPIATRLSKTGIATPESRIVVEKPFGHDLASAKELNKQLGACFEESQIYRIDHYLGKETVQNLMALRFANALLEPVWNSQHVDHVQISVSESIGVEGRGEYYDTSGAMRDMVQNHLMQLLCLTAMEPPAKFNADDVRDEKLKVIRSLDPVKPDDIVRGQYRASTHDGSYKDHAINPDSTTECFVALKAHISNWRWAGVPFYLRTGKKLRARMSEIAVIFKDPPHSIFPQSERRHEGNSLVIRLQPDEGITMHMIIKEPGQGGFRLTEVPLDMSFAEALGDNGEHLADAYERLMMDVIRGDQTLFMRGDEVEAAWRWTDPIIANWSGEKPERYDQGSSGPDVSLALMHRDSRRWRAIEV
ncbi:MAG: glucose-6-phosphate dehydrogenase [Paracoccaceae bacterium]|jgi:glucose-6-phosphate 1-dehydrogenase